MQDNGFSDCTIVLYWCLQASLYDDSIQPQPALVSSIEPQLRKLLHRTSTQKKLPLPCPLIKHLILHWDGKVIKYQKSLKLMSACLLLEAYRRPFWNADCWQWLVAEQKWPHDAHPFISHPISKYNCINGDVYSLFSLHYSLNLTGSIQTKTHWKSKWSTVALQIVNWDHNTATTWMLPVYKMEQDPVCWISWYRLL